MTIWLSFRHCHEHFIEYSLFILRVERIFPIYFCAFHKVIMELWPYSCWEEGESPLNELRLLKNCITIAPGPALPLLLVFHIQAPLSFSIVFVMSALYKIALGYCNQTIVIKTLLYGNFRPHNFLHLKVMQHYHVKFSFLWCQNAILMLEIKQCLCKQIGWQEKKSWCQHSSDGRGWP